MVAAPVEVDALGGVRVAISQTFQDDDVSWTTTTSGAGCVAGSVIDIEASSYVARDTGEAAPFESVIRSYAASAQLVGDESGSPLRLRVQVKYPLHRDHPVTLSVAGETFDLDAFRERAGDSVLIDAPDILAALRRADAAGDAATLVAVSAATGRLVTDTLTPPSFDALDACLAAGAPEDAPPPLALVTLRHLIARTPETVATLPEMRACGASESDGPIHRGALQAVTGFFAHTRAVYARFDADGAPRHLYVPGVFEAVREETGVWRADVSRAAAGNDPFEEGVVSGCLGAGAVTLCEDVDGALGPCVGEFLIGELDDDPFGEPGAASGGAGRGATTGATAPFVDQIWGPGFGGGFGRFGGSGGGGLSGGGAGGARGGFGGRLGGGASSSLESALDGGGQVSPPPLDQPMPVIPLPASIWLLGGALGLLGWRAAATHAARNSSTRDA